MRKRIGQIARGKIQYIKPVLTFSEEKVELRAYSDVDQVGSFTIGCENCEEVRGIVYSTDDHMECLTPQFAGDGSVIRYRFHGRGMLEGEKREGEFVVIANGSVSRLPFTAAVSNRYPESSIGEIKSLYDFSQLAKEHWDEAYKLFYQRSFKNLIKTKEVKESMIYRGILAARPCNRNMEEFLVGIRKKQRVTCTLEQRKASFDEVNEELRESVTVNRSGWGYLSLQVSADAAFLQPEQENIRPEDFLGNSFELHYRILPEHLHAGRNYGRIVFEDIFCHLEYEVTARGVAAGEKDPARRKVQEYKAGVVELYQAYRLKRIVTGVWANETVDILNHLIELDPGEPMYGLVKAQAFIINRQRQEAEWILDEFRRTWKNKKAPVWGYYLYLLTLMEREPAYVDKMTKEIEGIQRENPDSPLLFWVLSFLEEQYYNNSAEKLRAIERWVLAGNTSPYLYLEAYYIFCQDPYLLNSLGAFEIRILRWAVRNGALNRDLAIQIFSIAANGRGYSETEYRLMCAAYEILPTPENTGLICSYLIKGQKYEPAYHSWYERGIELELRITNLYEAYLMSMDEHVISNVPKIIQMYFQYESRLPYKKMAVLYNNIIASKNTEPDIYLKYRTTMGKFAMEQVELERIDDNLAVLYTEMLDLGLVNEELAHHLSRILFTRRIVVFDERMVRVWVYQRQTKEPQIVPVNDHAAYVQLFSQEYVVLFEDARGHRFVGSNSYQVQNLMDPEPYLEKCMGLAPEELPYIIWRFDTRQNYLNFTEEDEKFFARIIYSRSLSEEYRGQMFPEILRYYHIHPYRLKSAERSGEEAEGGQDKGREITLGAAGAYAYERGREKRSGRNQEIELKARGTETYGLKRGREKRSGQNQEIELKARGTETYSLERGREKRSGREKDTEKEKGTALADYLVEVDASFLSPESRRFYAEMLIECERYEHAWMLVQAYGTDLLRASSREKLASAIMERSGMDEDEFLVRLAHGAFADGMYSETLMSYLCRYYNGPTEQMLAVWKAVRERESGQKIDTRSLEERLLSQMIFSGEWCEGVEPLFEHYCENDGAADMLVLAYLTIQADDYFLHEGKDSGGVIGRIKKRFLENRPLNDSCKLALLKGISKGRGGGENYRIADDLLAEFTSRNMIFGFYKKLNRSLIQKYHLYDKVILEYRTSPQKRVRIHYSRDEDGTEFIAEDMTNAYNGIFVKQFVMFFGEIIQYYISEEQDGEVKMSQSNRLANHDIYNQKDESRYSLINQILMSNTLREKDSLKRYMLRYQELDEMTRQLFRIL